MFKSSFKCKHNRTAIKTVISNSATPADKKVKIQDKLICLDCDKEVDFSSTIIVPDSFLVSLHHNKKNRSH